MNPLIGNAIAKFDLRPNLTPTWEDVLMTRSRGSGFDLILLDKSGEPMRYCKLRLGDQHRLQHENSMVAMFRRSYAKDFVLESNGGLQDPWTVQVARFVNGPLLSKQLHRKSVDVVEATLASVVSLAESLSKAAATTEQAYRSRSLSLAIAVADATSYLKQLQPSHNEFDKLIHWLEEVESVPSSPQHGDLWANNVIWDVDRWRIIDLELFGSTSVPLYDMFHLLRIYYESIHPDAWVDQLTKSVAGAPSRRIISRFSSDVGLSPRQIIGTFIYYSIHQAASTQQDAFRAPAARAAAIRNLKQALTMFNRGGLGRALGQS